MDSFDFKLRKVEQIIKSVLDKLKEHGNWPMPMRAGAPARYVQIGARHCCRALLSPPISFKQRT